MSDEREILADRTRFMGALCFYLIIWFLIGVGVGYMVAQ